MYLLTAEWSFVLPLVIHVCPEMHANEMQALYNKHHKVSSHIYVHQNTHDSGQTRSNMKIADGLVIYEVVVKQNLCAFLDISVVIPCSASWNSVWLWPNSLSETIPWW